MKRTWRQSRSQRVLVRRTHELVHKRISVVHVSATESASENGPATATVAETSGYWCGSRGRRETRRSENVLDSARDGVDALGKSGKLGQGCVERAQIAGSRHGDMSTTPQQKGATRAHSHRRQKVQRRKRPANTTTGTERREAKPSRSNH